MTGDREAKQPSGRTLAEFGDLSPPEEKLLACVADGTVAYFGAERPSESTREKTVRAEFVRFLTLGGGDDAPVHEKGVRLWGAWIEGVLDLAGAESKGSLALFHSMLVEVPEFRDARIRGSLNLSGSQLPGFFGDRLFCGGALVLRDNLLVTGEVRLLGAIVNGQFSCSGGQFQNVGGNALSADRINVADSVYLDEGFVAHGDVRLVGATIGGDFNCRGGSFNNVGKDALSADRVRVGDEVYLDNGFSAQGAVRLLDATISGNFSCGGGSFQNAGGPAFAADRVKIGGDLSLNRGFAAQGGVRFPGATVAGNFFCQGGSFQNTAGFALIADGVKVRGDLNLGSGFAAVGEVRFVGAEISGDLSCRGGSFENSDGDALHCQSINVGGAFFFDTVETCIGAVDLTSGSVQNLVDDMKSWPAVIMLDGFRYNRLAGNSPITAKARLEWLDKQPAHDCGKDGKGEQFRPQPWLQLRNVLRAMGHYEAARDVGITFERRKRRCRLIGQTPETRCSVYRVVYGSAARWFHSLFGGLVDYGYRPVKLVLMVGFVWLVCTAAFYVGANNGYFAPRNPALYLNRRLSACARTASGRPHWRHCAAIPAEYPQFFPPIYALNVMLPVGNLGQEESWGPVMPKRTGPIGIPLGWGFVIQVLVWIETIFGWLASLILVAVASGLAKKDE